MNRNTPRATTDRQRRVALTRKQLAEISRAAAHRHKRRRVGGIQRVWAALRGLWA